MKYQHKIVRRVFREIEKLTAEFNLLGEQGWKLVAVDGDDFFFVREN